jgi:hypothetical protein
MTTRQPRYRHEVSSRVAVGGRFGTCSISASDHGPKREANAKGSRRLELWRRNTHARHRRRTPTRTIRETERTRDAGPPILDLKSRFPGVSRTAISDFRVPRLTRSRFGFVCRLTPSPACEQAARSYCRTGGSLAVSPLPRRQVSPPVGVGERGVCENLPGRAYRKPHAAGAASRPQARPRSPDLPLMAGTGEI